MARQRVLILFLHPALEQSRIHDVLAASVRDLDGVTFHDLYEHYPDFDVDVRAEQALLLAHDRIVFQHPFYWYNAPALLKQWQDLVLRHGWAYGTHGRQLEGKWALHATSTGGGRDAYGPGSFNRYTVPEFFRGFERTAELCHMLWIPPFVVHGSHRMTPQQAREQGASYRRLIEALRDDAVDLEAARALHCVSDDLDAVIGTRSAEGVGDAR